MVYTSIVIAAIAVASLMLSIATWRRQRDEAITAQVALVSVRYRPVTQRVPGLDPRQMRGVQGHEIVIRNDSAASVSVRAAGFAVGQPWVQTPLPYDPWQITWGSPIDDDWGSTDYVPPGSVAVFRMPSDWSSVGTGVGAVAVIRDSRGRDWRRLPDAWTALPTYTGPRRRVMWIQRQRWWIRLDVWAWQVTKRRSYRHPWRKPWTAHLADLWGGHRIGASQPVLLPPGCPRSWEYGHYWDPEYRRDWLEAHPGASLGHQVSPASRGNKTGNGPADTGRH